LRAVRARREVDPTDFIQTGGSEVRSTDGLTNSAIFHLHAAQQLPGEEGRVSRATNRRKSLQGFAGYRWVSLGIGFLWGIISSRNSGGAPRCAVKILALDQLHQVARVSWGSDVE
jgi:hypothetical protein